MINALAIVILVAILYVCGARENLIIATLAGIASGVISYYVSRNEIKKIIRDDEEEEMKISSEENMFWVTTGFGCLVGILSWGNAPLSFMSFIKGIGWMLVVILISGIVMTSFTNIHLPTHDLRTKKDD